MSIADNTQHRAQWLTKLAECQNTIVDLQILIDVAMQAVPSQLAQYLLGEADVHLDLARAELERAALRIARLP